MFCGYATHTALACVGREWSRAVCGEGVAISKLPKQNIPIFEKSIIFGETFNNICTVANFGLVGGVGPPKSPPNFELWEGLGSSKSRRIPVVDGAITSLCLTYGCTMFVLDFAILSCRQCSALFYLDFDRDAIFIDFVFVVLYKALSMHAVLIIDVLHFSYQCISVVFERCTVFCGGIDVKKMDGMRLVPGLSRVSRRSLRQSRLTGGSISMFCCFFSVVPHGGELYQFLP